MRCTHDEAIYSCTYAYIFSHYEQPISNYSDGPGNPPNLQRTTQNADHPKNIDTLDNDTIIEFSTEDEAIQRDKSCPRRFPGHFEISEEIFEHAKYRFKTRSLRIDNLQKTEKRISSFGRNFFSTKICHRGIFNLITRCNLICLNYTFNLVFLN